jgi:integrase
MDMEAERRGLAPDSKMLEGVTAGDIVRRYRDEIVPDKPCCRSESGILKAMLDRNVVRVALSDLTPTVLSRYRDERLKLVKPATVVRELGLLRHALEIARQEWGVPFQANPVAAVRKPKLANRRERRLQPGEWERLDLACATSGNPVIHAMVGFALESAMRRGELLNATWRDVNLKARTLHIPITKNGNPRTIPLTSRAIEILTGLKGQREDGKDRLFPTTISTLQQAWVHVLRRAGITDLRFHDLRHEAISRSFEKGLSVPEVAHISGHRDPRMLFRYTHLRAEDIAAKLT